MVADREFRNDLYYRLNVFRSSFLQLRERRKIFTTGQSVAHRRAEWGVISTAFPPKRCAPLGSVNGRERSRLEECRPARRAADGAAVLLQLSLPDITAVTPDTSPVGWQEGEKMNQLIIRVLKETNGVVAGPGAARRLGA
ncbi:hypothetical protein KCP74_11125 [Salmonella enterica subsp. enterica]|nr:hypothetical protein KCP74_11125 [Salmonella enterica subsp. enterica]